MIAALSLSFSPNAAPVPRGGRSAIISMNSYLESTIGLPAGEAVGIRDTFGVKDMVGVVAPTNSAGPTPTDPSVVARRKELAEKFVRNEGFYNRPLCTELLSDEFVWFGPIVGPLCKDDFLGTLRVFAIYDSVSNAETHLSEFAQDPLDADRYWATHYYKADHTAPLNTGAATYAATGNKIEVGPTAVSVTFDKDDKIEKFTGGYITDKNDNPAGPLGAAFAVMKAVGGFVPKLWLAKILNWIGAKVKNFPKAVSHVDDLPAKWKHMGRTHGLRVAQAWE